MKTVLIFIILKIAEIGGIVFIPYWLGLLWSKIIPGAEVSKFGTWFVGFLFTLLSVVIGFGIFVFCVEIVPLFFASNWQLAKELSNG